MRPAQGPLAQEAQSQCREGALPEQVAWRVMGHGRGMEWGTLPVRPHAIAYPQGMPGKDGRDGVPGQDGEKVGTWPVGVYVESSASWASAPHHRQISHRERLVAMVPQERRVPVGCR